MPWNGNSAFQLLTCLLVHLLLAAVVSAAAAPAVKQQNANITEASCSLVIQGHSAGDVKPLTNLMWELGPGLTWDKLNLTVPSHPEVTLICTPPDVVSVMVPDNSWLAAYKKNFSGVKLVAEEDCAWQAALSSSAAAGELPGERSNMHYCAMSVCSGNTSNLQVVFNDFLIGSNIFDGVYLAPHPYLLCFQGLVSATLSLAVVSHNQYVSTVVGSNPSLPSIMAVDRGAVLKCNNCSFVQNYGARPLAVWGMAVLDQTDIRKNVGALVGEKTFPDAGPVFAEQGADLHVHGCTFAQNGGASDGSALYARGNVSIDNCTFEKNVARSSGGAIRADLALGSTLVVNHCKILGNRWVG